MSDDLHLGARLDPESGKRLDEAVLLPPGALTTHGVIVGMTGSGKTGLGIVLLEEILSSGRPALILDPKGDLANLLLLFPELRPADFEPWVDPAEARREGISVGALAEATANRWKKGLASWGIDGSRISRLRDAVDLRVYTPGSSAGAPLDLVGSMQAPADADEEARRDAAEGLVSGLLTLADLESDPLTSPAHILLANLVEHAWQAGRPLDLETLIGQVQIPPFRKLGVFEVDSFMPPPERTKLALRLNGLVASPSFASWRQGDPLDVDRLLRAPDGRPRASIVQLAHLSDPERMFVVTLLLSRMVAWMRGQAGTSDLRALVYIDELFGFAPPTATPPSKKPLLTLFKQARAHGLGVVVSTQNPVDMDYKLMSNAGTWMVGRLQTERDKARIIEALQTADGSVDVRAWDARIGDLGKRQFLLKRTRSPEPTLFTSRWAMAYLRGPITRAELASLPAEAIRPAAGEDAPAPRGPDGTPEPSGAVADDETPLAPAVADGVRVKYLDASAPWAEQLGISASGTRLAAGLATRVRLLFDDERASLRHEEEWESVSFPLGTPFLPDEARSVDYDARDFVEDPPVGARYVLTDVPLDERSFFRSAEKALADWLYGNRTLKMLRNRTLKLYSRADEDRERFGARCLEAAEERADGDVAKLRESFERRLDTAKEQADRAGRRVRELEVDASSRRNQEVVAGAGELIGMFLGGRRRTRSLSGVASRRAQTRRTQERLRSAEDKLRDELEDIDELEDQLADKLEEIWDRWRDVAQSIEEVDIALEKSDIRVEETILFWAPVAD